jgi:HD-like signal output (HDOD) protein
MGGEARGSLYLAGLLHNVGRLVVLHAAGRSRRFGTPSPYLVREIMTVHQQALGMMVSRAWQLSNEVASGVAFHHCPEHCPEEGRRIAVLLRGADLACKAIKQEQRGATRTAEPALQELQDLPVLVNELLVRAHETMVREGTLSQAA